MDDQNSNAVSDVMKNVNGVSVQNYDSDRWSFQARQRLFRHQFPV
jgi:outer membrane receptor for ferric coprogen and ferric-rhodotorulic acid